MKRFCIAIIALASVHSVSCQKIEPREDNEQIIDRSDFIAIFGDIQYYTNSSYIDLYSHSVNWILQKKQEGINISCVLQTGDITQTNAEKEWYYFDSSMSKLSQSIPFYSMIGNHDYSWYDTKITDRNDTHFSEYLQYPLSTSKIINRFEVGHMENIIVENTIHGQRYDLIILEYGPRPEVIEWAKEHVKGHPDIKFFLLTHEYLEKGGGRRTEKLTMEKQFPVSTYTTPDDLWNDLIKCNDNIRVVLCGHVGGLYALTMDTNDFGREIPQIQHNIQSQDYRYENWLMLWEFPANCDSANVFIYNTQTEQYYDDKKSLFKFKYKDSSPVSGTTIIKQNLPLQKVYGINGIKIERRNRGLRIVKDYNGTKKILR